MKTLGLSLVASTLLLSQVVVAGDTKNTQKRTLDNSMNVEYKILPSDVEQIGDLFTKGMVYGRLRIHAFQWDWKDENFETGGEQKNNYALGIGGSLIFKTARFHGWSGTIGLYTSQNPFSTMEPENMKYIKAGKDTLSRYAVKNSTDNEIGMTVIGESYLQYDGVTTKYRLGRQLFESPFTASNDTKMIPNSFDGLTVESKIIKDSEIQLAYFQRQKLRDHTSSHDVLTFGDEKANNWGNQDDSAVHKGLSYANFVKAGEDPDNELVIATVKNKSLKNLELSAGYLAVPEVLNQTVVEANAKIDLGSVKLGAGARYMIQGDDGAGDIGGASISGKLAGWTTGDKRGYVDPKNLESSLFAVKLTAGLLNNALNLHYGYSQVSDDADFVSPWRGFPTAGYTRPMALLNWYANTKTSMLQANFDLGKLNIIDGTQILMRYAMVDNDEEKPDVESDRNVIEVTTTKNWKSFPNFQSKIRLGFVDADEKNSIDSSYNEYRLELNYLF